jgi:chromosome segregation and condensation protein ScpB
MTGTLQSVEFVKEMMEIHTTEYPFKYVPGKEFLPNFALENNKRLSHLRAI